MVSRRRRKAKNSSPFLSVLDWFRILCSGCFGKIDQLKKPLLPGNPSGLSLESLVMEDCLPDSIHGSTDYPSLYGSAEDINSSSSRSELPGGGDDDDDDADMFHGHFLLGSIVLTEVELQSPVEDSRVLATPIRTPRRSNNSSCMSSASARELDPDSWQIWTGKGSDSSHTSLARDSSHLGSSQVCALDSFAPGSSVDVTSPCGDAEATRTSVLSMHEQDDESLTDPYWRNCQNEHPCAAAQLHMLNEVLATTGPSLTLDLQSIRESDNLSDADRPSDNKQRNMKNCVARVPKCNVDEEDSAADMHTLYHSERITAETHTISQAGWEGLRLGSLPECTPSNFLAEKSPEKYDGRRLRARSLTDQDFMELKGCIDLGFVFPSDHVPDLRETLPALEVCYAVAHGAISPVSNLEDSKLVSPDSPPISPWRIASPGDQPQQVKARLRHWAQAVACNVRHPC